MRKRDKKQILELIHMLEEANDLLLSMLHGASDEELVQILSDEQSVAISIGNRIEELEGEGTKAVGILEQYCELLWQIAQETDQESRKQGVEQLLALIMQENAAVTDIHETIDVVFLPYKASMWDCMETVWKAAQEDPDCNAYVIPIPYCDRNPDGSVAQWHYEADLFPKGVPVTSYEKYSLKEHRPDIIYIHNPYDHGNIVTSVHPDYYSSELKKYTDMLVYIPYFLLEKHLPETHSLLPAYLNVDYIILNTAEMVDDIDENIPREKLLILGSPKEERIHLMNEHREQLEIPKEWLSILKGKKIIFYNTSISDLLKKGEKRLDKIEEFLDVIEHMDGIAVIWRPHPLLEATFKSMRPELLVRYHNLLRRFQKKRLGILDYSGDPGVAVALADAYVGDSASSIIDLFRVLDKPRFFQNNNAVYQPTYDELISDITLNSCRAEDDVYFIAAISQTICRLSLKSYEITSLAKIPETRNAGWQYSSIEYYEGKLYCPASCAESGICIYDIEKNSFSKIYFRQESVQRSFSVVKRYKHFLYCIPACYSSIVRFDMETGSVKYYDEPVHAMIEKYPWNEKFYNMFGTPEIVQNELILPYIHGNLVLILNLDNEIYEIHEVGTRENKFASLCVDRENIWLVNFLQPRLVRWNRKQDEAVEFPLPAGECQEELGLFARMIQTQNALYLLPVGAEHAIKFDKQKEKAFCADKIFGQKPEIYVTEYFKTNNARNTGCMIQLDDGKILAFSHYDRTIFITDLETEQTDRIPLRIPQRIYLEAQYYPGDLKKIWENTNMTLAKYLQFVKESALEANCKLGRRVLEQSYAEAGKQVHEVIKSLEYKAGKHNLI